MPTLIMLLIKATCLLLIAVCTARVLQRAPAGARHLVWLVSLGALLILPALTAWSPLRMRVIPAALLLATPASGTAAVVAADSNGLAQAVATSTGVRAPFNDAAASGVTANNAREPSGASAGEWRSATILRQNGAATLLAIWATVAVALLGRLAYGVFSVRRIVRRAHALQRPEWQVPLYEIADRLGLDAAPRLVRSNDVKMPFAAGFIATTIVLPAGSDEWSADRRKAVLLHELGHVSRHDLVGHTVARVACALYWFHPLVWTAARALRAESERACDDLAITSGTRPSDYAEHLLEIVTSIRDHAIPSVAMAMAHRKEFEGRVLAILNPELRRKALGRAPTTSLVAVLMLLVAVVGAAAPVASDLAPALPIPSAPRSPPVSPTAAAPLASSASAPGGQRADLRPLTVASGPDTSRAEALAKLLDTDADPSVRRIAAWGLNAYAQHDVAADALRRALTQDDDIAVREMSAWALATAPHRSTVSAALARAVRMDRDENVRRTAIWALASGGECERDGDATSALVLSLGDAEARVRELAAWAIGTCRPTQSPRALVRALSDESRDVRVAAAWALYTIADPTAVPALDSAFRRETDPEVQRGLIRALGSAGDASVDVLQRLVSSPDKEIRTTAVTMLAGGQGWGPWPWPRPRPRPSP